MKEFKNFYEEYEDMFEEYLEDVIGNLKNKNEIYKELQSKYSQILNENQNIAWILEGQNEDRQLSNEECKTLFKLIQINFEMKQLEKKEVFFAGGKEAYIYFKNIGIIQ